MMKLEDIASMPNFNSNVPNGTRSVSNKKVFYGRHSWQSKYSVNAPQCIVHGALLCVAKTGKGKIWRCDVCNEGCYTDNAKEFPINSKEGN